MDTATDMQNERVEREERVRLAKLERHEKQMDALRKAEELLEPMAGHQMPSVGFSDWGVRLSWWLFSKEEFRAVKAALATVTDGMWEKGSSVDTPTFEKQVDGVEIRLVAGWGHCRQVETGETEVKRIREEKTPASYIEVEKGVPVYRKECPGLEELLGEDD